MNTKLALLTFLTLALTACGSNEENGSAPAGPATVAPAPEETTPKRTLVDARAMGTRPSNLVVDPTFATVNTMYGANILRSDDIDLRVEVPPTSPAGIAQPVLVAKATGLSAAVLFAVQVGGVPLDASVFVAVSAGQYVPEVRITSLDGGESFVLEPTNTTERHGDTTYKLHRARIDKAVFGRLYFYVELAGDAVTFAKPEVVQADPAKPGRKAQVIALDPQTQRKLRTLSTRAARLPDAPRKNGLLASPLRAPSALR